MKFHDFFWLVMPKKMKKFWVGRSEVPEIEKVMSKGKGGVQSDPLPTTQCVVCSEILEMYRM